MFYCLKQDNIGWAKQMEYLLEEYKLDYTYNEIADMTKQAWKKKVAEVTEKKNKERMVEMCHDGQKEKNKNKRATL